MRHIVERLIDGLPAYLREDYPKFVELIRAYYTWQSQDGKFLDGVYGHEARIDIDRQGLTRVIEEMDEADVPEEHRRAFVMFAREFNSSRGSVASFTNFFRIFFDSPVRISNSSRYVFMPSSAVRERYQRAVVHTASLLPSGGVLRQSFGGGVADVVAANCLAVRGSGRVYEVVVVLRNDRFYPGSAIFSNGADEHAVEFVPYSDFTAVTGHSYSVGDKVVVSTELQSFIGAVKTLSPIQVEAVTVDAPGTGYRLGDVVTIVGARGFRAEVSAVGSGGGISEVRVIDVGDPFGGVPVFFIASSTGSGAQFSYGGVSGRPLALEFEMHPFGVVTGMEIVSDAGVDAAFLYRPRLFQETWVPRGYNGVLGVGSTITDSAAYQDASYIVATPVDSHKWASKVKRLLHPVGRYMHAVKTAGAVIPHAGFGVATSAVVPYEYLAAEMATGSSAELGELEVTPPPIDLSILLDTGAGLEEPVLFKPPAEFVVLMPDGSSLAAATQTTDLFDVQLGAGQSSAAGLT